MVGSHKLGGELRSSVGSIVRVVATPNLGPLGAEFSGCPRKTPNMFGAGSENERPAGNSTAPSGYFRNWTDDLSSPTSNMIVALSIGFKYQIVGRELMNLSTTD